MSRLLKYNMTPSLGRKGLIFVKMVGCLSDCFYDFKTNTLCLCYKNLFSSAYPKLH